MVPWMAGTEVEGAEFYRRLLECAKFKHHIKRAIKHWVDLLLKNPKAKLCKQVNIGSRESKHILKTNVWEVEKSNI